MKIKTNQIKSGHYDPIVQRRICIPTKIVKNIVNLLINNEQLIKPL